MTWRRWTEQEDMLVETMLQQGSSLIAIAQKTRRTYHGVHRRLRYVGSSVRDERNRPAAEVRSSEQIGILFGVSGTTIRRWIAWGWIATKRNGARRRRGAVGPRSHYLITDEALIVFVARRDTWMAWNPEQMTDPDWREYAEDERRAAGGHWMSLSDVARHFDRPYTTIAGWCQRGVFADLTSTRYGKLVYFWSADMIAFAQNRRPT